MIDIKRIPNSDMNKALEEAGITDFIMNEVRYIPSNYITLDEDKTNKILISAPLAKTWSNPP